MHEQSLMDGLMHKIYALAAEHRASRITAVQVRLGALSHMSPGHFREHFAQAAQGSIAENATLRIETSDDTTEARAQDVVLEEVEVE